MLLARRNGRRDRDNYTLEWKKGTSNRSTKPNVMTSRYLMVMILLETNHKPTCSSGLWNQPEVCVCA